MEANEKGSLLKHLSEVSMERTSKFHRLRKNLQNQVLHYIRDGVYSECGFGVVIRM